MGVRTTAREAALQMLYAVEAGEHGVEHTAISSTLVFSVISVHKFEEWTTPWWF